MLGRDADSASAPGQSSGKLGNTLGDTQECPQTGREPKSPMQPQFQQCLKPLTLQTPASEALLTGPAFSRAASPPSKRARCITLRHGTSTPTSRYSYRDVMRQPKKHEKPTRVSAKSQRQGDAASSGPARHDPAAVLASGEELWLNPIGAAFQLLNQLLAARS